MYQHPAFWPGLVFLVSFALRLGWAAWATVTPVSDCAGYDTLAQGLANGEDFGQFQGESHGQAYRTPGYPAFLAAIYVCFGHSPRAAAVAQAFVSALTTLLLFWLARRFVNRRASLLAAGLHAFSPVFLVYVPLLATETVATCLGVAALLLLCPHVQPETPRRGWRAWGQVALSGAIMGLNLLVRPSGLFFLPGLVLVLALRTDLSWRGRALGVGVFVLALSAVLAPWMIRNVRIGAGATLSTTGGWNLYMGNNDRATTGGHLPVRLPRLPGETDADLDRRYTSAAIDWILTHPARYLRLSTVRFFRLVGTEPDSWAAQNLWPTRQNDKLVHDYYWARRTGNPDPELVKQYRRKNANHRAFLKFIRDILAPLGLVALVLGFASFRKYRLLLIPWASYTLGLTFTVVANRYALPSQPLLFVLIGALLSDLVFRTREFPWPARYQTLVGIAAATLMLLVLLEGTGFLKKIYIAPLPRETARPVSNSLCPEKDDSHLPQRRTQAGT